MNWKNHLFLVVVLCGLVVLTIGFPHGKDSWFAYWNSSPENESMQWTLLTIYRIPEIAIAIIAGMALSVSGLLLQTVLNNPLAGPSILGLTSGSHLFVALAILGGSSFSFSLIPISLTIASALGALFFGLLIMLVAARIRSQVSLLLIGLMLGTCVSALTGIVLSKADPTAIKAFTLWSFGSLQTVNLDELPFIFAVFICGFAGAFFLTKPLNALVLGDKQAELLGVNIRRTQWLIIGVVALLTGLITAFCGPIAFIGLIVPNLVKLFYKTAQHRHLLVSSALLGAIVLLLCDWLIVVVEPYFVLPINSLTSFMGAPVVIILIIKNTRNA